MSVLQRTRQEKKDEVQGLVLRVMESRRMVESSSDMNDVVEVLVDEVHDQWEDDSLCDIDRRDVYQALKSLHYQQKIRVSHLDRWTGESRHRVALMSVY